MPNRISIVATVKDNVSGDLSRIRDKFDALGKGAASSMLVGQLGAAAFEKAAGAASEAVIGFAGDSIRAASDLNETLSKSQVIFGDSAGRMEQFGEQAAKSLGLSEQAAIEAGATFGNFFRGVGQGQPAAEQMSESLVKLAGDLASFNNLDPSEVLDKLRSGLVGEAEPLRSVGVFLTEDKVKAKALQMGLADAHGELSEGAKVMARYQLIMDETKTAQGDFARTADGLANTQRSANAELENAKAKLGAGLLPAANDAVKVFTVLVDKTADLADGIRGAGADTGDLVKHLVDLQQLTSNPYDYLGNLLGGKPSADAARQNLESVIPDSLKGDIRTVGEGFGDLNETMDRTALAASAVAGAGAAAAVGIAGAGGAAKSAIDPTYKYWDWLRKVADAEGDASKNAQDLERDISDLASELDKTLFGGAETAGRRQELTDEIAGLEKKLKDTKDKGDAVIIRGQIAGLRQELFDLDLQEAASKGPQAAIDFLKRIQTHSATAKAEIQKLIAKYEALLALGYPASPTRRGATSGGQNYGPNAAGGVIPPGGYGTVGEDGIEKIRVDEYGNAIITPITGAPKRGSGMPGNSAFGLSGGAGFHGGDERANPVPGEIHQHFEIHVHGNLVARNAEELGQTLRRISAVGLSRSAPATVERVAS